MIEVFDSVEQVKARLDREKRRNTDLHKLIWAIVKKHGGEIKLDEIERGILCDDWRLLTTELPSGELLLRSEKE